MIYDQVSAYYMYNCVLMSDLKVFIYKLLFMQGTCIPRLTSLSSGSITIEVSNFSHKKSKFWYKCILTPFVHNRANIYIVSSCIVELIASARA